jgi:predicted ATPase
MIGERWFPFVRLPIDPVITAVVGANESGKSHLIKAIEKGLTGQGIDRSDFCRYSSLYSVKTGELRVPDIGLELTIEDVDTEPLRELGIEPQEGKTITLLRLDGGVNRVLDHDHADIKLAADKFGELDELLPHPFELRTDVALPDTVSFAALTGERDAVPARRERHALLDLFKGGSTEEATVNELAPQIAGALTPKELSEEEREKAAAEEDLARKLLLDVAQIDPAAVRELQEAVREQKEGRVAGLEAEMNKLLAGSLNFARWWRQDRDFQLLVEAREHDLAFTITDRTGSSYSFDERSMGLKFFLGYYVQLLAHKPPESGRSEVLLMDEPDAFLSSSGQQDLLRRLERYAEPNQDGRGDQVVYVTHSPFLINKNAAHRIRVLSKGDDEEGTRVVRDAVRNHYEPLRSSIGSYVAETAFIGGSNLMVEGAADQVLLAGVASHLRREGAAPSQVIDLNDVTVVPAASASEVPYLVYLARGRDEIKPPCVALLDGDQAGLDAIKTLASGRGGKAILHQDFVVNLADWADKEAGLKTHNDLVVKEIEDLVPTKVAAGGARGYAERFSRIPADDVTKLTAEAIDTAIANGKSVWAALEQEYPKAYGKSAHIDKTGFAKEVIAYLKPHKEGGQKNDGVPDLEKNFAQLIEYLARKLRAAQRSEEQSRRDRRLKHLIEGFTKDHPATAPRDEANQVLEAIEATLEEGEPEDNPIRAEVLNMRKQFDLTIDALEPVPDFAKFRERLEGLPHQKRIAVQEEE